MNPTIEHNFKYHPPKGNAAETHGAVRAKAKELANLIDALLPERAGREKATALTKVEEAMMWACAGIARHSVEAEPRPVHTRPECPFNYCDQPAPHTACLERCHHRT